MLEDNAVANAIPVSTLDESGNPPKERIATATRCRALAAKLIENDDLRNKFDTRVRGMRDGNPPFRNATLKKYGQANRTNINWMEGKAIISAAMVPYYDLMAGSLYLCQVKLEGPDPSVTAEKGQIVTEEFDYMLREWGAFGFNIDLMMADRLTYGKGFLMWPDEYDPEFCWVNRFNVHVPDRTRACVDYLEVLVIEEDMPVDKLWRSMKDGEARGWVPDECKASIKDAEPDTLNNDPYRHDLEQQRRNDRDILDGVSTPKVKAAHVLVKEFNGKISHYIVDLAKVSKPTMLPNEQKEKGYLFKKVGRFDNWHQAFWASFHETLDGSWNGASAIGKDIIAQVEIKNRVKCATVDLGFMRSSVGMQAQNEAAFGKAQVIQQGAVTVYPPGLTPIPVATHVGDIESVMALDADIEQTIGRNTGIYRQLPEKAKGNPLTATGEMLRNQQSAVLTNAAVVRFYSDLDRMYSEVYRRTVECPASLRSERVKRFISRCKDRGVEEKELKNWECVRSYRNIGNGSLVMRQQNLAQLGSIVQLFPQSGQRSWVRDTVSALTNVDTADRYVPLDPAQEITLDHSLAMLENDSLAHGSPVAFSPDQNHVIHAQLHMQAAAQGLESVQAGAQPETVLAALEGLMPHANAHIAALEGNPQRKNEAKMLREQWNQIAKMADDLRKAAGEIMQKRAEMAEAQRKAQAIQDGQDPETVIKAAETQQKLQMSWQRAQAKMQMDLERLKADMALQGQRQQAEMAMRDAETAASITRSNAETLASIERQRKETAAKIETQKKEQETKAKEAESSEGAGGGESKPKKAAAPTLNISVSADSKPKKGKKKFKVNRDAKGKIAEIVAEEDENEQQ